MKKFFSLLTLALLTMSAWAATTVTFDYTADTGDWTAAGEFSVTKDGVTLHFSNGTINAAYRVYASSTLTISSASENITEIKFTCTSGNPATNFESFDGFDTSTGIWTGNAESVEFTANAQVRATKIEVTIGEGETPPDPEPENVVTFDATVDIPNVNNDAFSLTKDDVTFAVSKGTCESNTGHYRIFKNQTATFTSAGADIVKIEMKCTAQDDAQYGPGCFTVNGGNYTYSGYNGTWVGKADEVIFTASTNQVRPITITVTLDDGTTVIVAAPTFNPAAGEFEEPFNLTLTAEDGATIYYSYDNENWTEYTAPLPISETTTVYAKAVKDDVESVVVSATYTYKEPATEVESLEITADMGNNIDFTFTGNAGVTVQKGGYLWLRDDTGYGLIFGNTNDGANPVFTPGTMLQPGWTAKTKIYSGLMEFVNATGLDSIGFNADYAEPLTITELSEDMLNAYVQVLNVKSFAVNNRNVTATLADGTTMVMYNQFNNEVTVPTTEGNYTVLGAVSTHDGLQLTILSIEGNFVVAPTLPASCNFEESMTVEITCNDEDATVMYGYDGTTWTEYSEVLTITETTTVYAKAVKGDIESEVVSATYTKVDPADQVTYTLVTDVAELADGDKIILVGYCNTEGEDYGKAYAMAEYRGEHYSNFNAVEVTVENNTVTTGLANVITLEANGNLWNLKAEEGYLWAAGNSTTNTKNHMRVEDEPDADGNANALIYMDTDSMSISFQGTNTRNFLRYNYNGGNPLFSCYAQGSSVQTPAYIFKAQAQAEGLRGDVNDDKAVTIGDVTDLIDYLLSGNDEGINLQNANCNLDEGVTISDVTALIDFLLSGQW